MSQRPEPLRDYTQLSSRPWWLLARGQGRLLGRHNEGPLLDLWTIQSKEAYELLTRSGALRQVPERRTDWLVGAYTWLEGEAANRLPTPGEHLMWAYTRIRPRDLRSDARTADGQVLLHLRMPSDHVLQLPYGDWHCVLSCSPVVMQTPGEPDGMFSARVDAVFDAWFDEVEAAGVTGSEFTALPERLQQQLAATWVTLFNQSTWSPTETLQCVAHEFRAEHVVSATKIVAPHRRDESTGVPQTLAG